MISRESRSISGMRFVMFKLKLRMSWTSEANNRPLVPVLKCRLKWTLSTSPSGELKLASYSGGLTREESFYLSSRNTSVPL